MTCTCETYIPNPNAPADVTIARRDEECPKHGDEATYVRPAIMRMRSIIHPLREMKVRDSMHVSIVIIEEALDELLRTLHDDEQIADT